MSARLVDLEMQTLVAESVSGIAVVVKRIDLPAKELAALAQSISEKGGIALLAGAGDIGQGCADICKPAGKCRRDHHAGLQHNRRKGRRQTNHGTWWRT